MAYKKCLLCGEVILATEPFVPYKGKYAHEHCFNKTIKQIGQAKKATLNAKECQNKKGRPPKTVDKKLTEIKDGLSEEEFAKKKQYYNYLQMLLSGNQLTVKHFTVSEKYIEQYSFTFEGMYQTLVYLNEIIHKELVGDIVGIIPYYYNEAMMFFTELNEIENNNKKIDITKLYPERIVRSNRKPRNIKQLDIENIGE